MASNDPAIPSTSMDTASVILLGELQDDLDTSKREICILKDEVARLTRRMNEQKRIRTRLKRKYLYFRRLDKKRSSSVAFLEFRSLVSKMKKEHKIRATLQHLMMVLNEEYKKEKNSQSKVEEVKEKEKTEEEFKHAEEKKADTATQALVNEIDEEMKNLNFNDREEKKSVRQGGRGKTPEKKTPEKRARKKSGRR